MIKKENLGPWAIWIIAFLFLPAWFFHFKISHLEQPRTYFFYTSQITALLGFALFSLSFVLSTRIKWLEDYFGGLDKIYQTHHIISEFAFILLLIHPIMLSLRFVPSNMNRFLWYFFPTSQSLGFNLGSIAWWGLIILMFFTFFIRLPYDKWKISHKLLGIFFILAAVHSFMLGNAIKNNSLLLIYFLILTIFGTIAYFYKTILFYFVVKRYPYRVKNINRLNTDTMEITLIPTTGSLKFLPGQFGFFRFVDLSREYHPFTICSAPGEKNLQIIIKALGDATNTLFTNLNLNTLVYAEGPYGRFYNMQGNKNQVWICGGVGVVPFIGWITAMLANLEKTKDRKIDFYYCVNKKDEFIRTQDIKKMEKENNNFHAHFISADTDGLLDVKKIKDIQAREIFLCGPKTMRVFVIKQLKHLNVPDKYIHYEDFDFF